MYKITTEKLVVSTLVIGIIISLAVANIRVREENEELRSRPPSSSIDGKFIEAAAKLWAVKTHTPPEQALKDRYARVMRIGDAVCVSIEVETGGVGGVPVYCFDEASTKIKLKYDDVE